MQGTSSRNTLQPDQPVSYLGHHILLRFVHMHSQHENQKLNIIIGFHIRGGGGVPLNSLPPSPPPPPPPPPKAWTSSPTHFLTNKWYHFEDHASEATYSLFTERQDTLN